MERAVECQLWLRPGVKPKGEFEAAFSVIAGDCARKNKKKSKGWAGCIIDFIEIYNSQVSFQNCA